MRWLVAIALLVAAPVASAAPKGAAAKAAFDTGVAAYTKGDYAAASESLGTSYELEADVETLFAWAQTERKLEHCDKATELYGKLLQIEMPAENKAVVQSKLEECRQIRAAQKPEPVVTLPPPVVTAPGEPVSPPSEEIRAWWKNPVGGALVGIGVVGLGVGGVFMVQARAANKDKASATTYGEFERLDDRASSRGKLGVIGLVGGGVLVGAGIVWYATHGRGKRSTQVTGWLAPEGGGVLAFGAF
ncbi:hypothetical protein BH11MYX3_BH11MYX3_07300 [soil metagenome]